MKTAMQNLICHLFHKIETFNQCLFVDKVSKKCVGKYRCDKCGKNFLSNKKRLTVRLYQ